jgi:hypothetical protein
MVAGPSDGSIARSFLVNELARRAEPSRPNLSEHYNEIVELTLTLVRRR